MSRFTIFSIILSVTVITVFADLLVRDYVQENGLSSVLNAGQKVAQNSEEISPVLDDSNDEKSDVAVSADVMKGPQSKPVTTVTPSTPTSPDSSPSETATSVPTTTNPVASNPATSTVSTSSTPSVTNITVPRIKSAGFTGTLEEKQFPGKLYQLLDISTFPVEDINNFMVQENSVSAAAITEIVLRDEIQALQLYLLLQNKTKPYIDLSLNETNAYGDRSFYINHAKKPNEAFLTVKIKNRIYGFAYVKFYHPELKKLIALLMEI